jgi:uncharacterized protein YqjF (DUF2071 family)
MSSSKTESPSDKSIVIQRSLSSSWRKLLNFKFMTHDRWANVLFLHWKVPPHLEAVLQEQTAPFLLDRFPSNDENDNANRSEVYIGLILLTEQNVGPSVGRTKWTTVTHHGVNVRTYVQGRVSSANPHPTPGIHFSSLECDDELTSYGANYFGMPYKMAQIQRFFELKGSPSNLFDTAQVDRLICSAQQNDGNQNPIQRFRLRSQRLSSERPSLWRVVTNLVGSIFRKATVLHRSEIKAIENETNPPESTDTFTVDCTWTVQEEPAAKFNAQISADNKFSQWVVERYYVYTQKYGLHWSGRVEHESWPLQPVELETLEISGVDAYEPRAMRPILEHMAQHRPDSVLFSPGVGPVQFNMLRPL